jgi:glycosyltransferase involved in cell wall biosynthesis
MTKKWTALIPVFEPQDILIDLLREVKKAGFQAVVVNDGSKEAFDQLFFQASEYAVVLTHSENMGKGRALKTGMKYIQKKYDKDCIVVTLDGDGQHTVKDAVKICRLAQDNPETLVIGSRVLRRDIPLRSWFGNTVTRLVYRIATGRKIYDTQTGLRAFSGLLLPKFYSVKGERYEYEMNMLLYCAYYNIPVKEAEIETIYINENRSSHFHTLWDSCRIYKEIIKFSLSSFVGFLIDYTMYSLLLILTSGLGSLTSLRIANVGARLVSASVNYSVNRGIVFQSDKSVIRSGLEYFILAVVILIGNTFVLSLLAENWGVNRFAAKIMTEILFFLISWMIQRGIIFRKKGKAYE